MEKASIDTGMAVGADSGEKPGTSFTKPPSSPPSLGSQRGGTEGPFCATCQGELKGPFQPKLFSVYSKKKGRLKYFQVEALRPCSYHTSNTTGRANTSQG